MPCTPTYYPNGLRVGSCFEIEDGTTITGLFKKQIFTSDGTIDDDTDLVVSTGDNDLFMPLTPTKGILEVKSISGTVSLDPFTNSIENGNDVTPTVNRRFNLEGIVWLELS